MLDSNFIKVLQNRLMKYEFSAGGVVFREINGTIEILLAQHSQHHGWGFPKGLMGDHKEGEGKEETAMREVQEETGATGMILHPLAAVSFWYQWQNEKRKKTVYYYVMKYIEGDISKHDFEMENVVWVPSEKVKEKLTYNADKNVWKEAKKYINNFAKNT